MQEGFFDKLTTGSCEPVVRLSNKWQSHLFEGMQSAARRICPPKADKPHTCSLRSVFPDAHVARKNGSSFFRA